MNVFGSLHKDIISFLNTHGIVNPTDIQQNAIPLILEGHQNSLLLAPTGSGKTEAALVPLLNKLYLRKQERDLFGFYILYITPLRALNRDVFKRIEDLCIHLGLTVAVRHGDTTQYARRKQAIYPPNLLITTPESLQAILPGKRLRYHLRTVFAVIVDEIHELADSKRGTQLSLGLERLENLVGSPLQRVGLSATVGNVNEVAKFLGGSHRQVRTVWAGYNIRDMKIRVEMPTPSKKHKISGRKISYPQHSMARLDRIMELITSHHSTLVFTNTRSFAEVLGAKMRMLKPSYEFDVHHGSLAKNVRLDAEDRLKTGITKAIIATSSLELGIDIGQADLVVQYSSPREVSRALQRIGRSGHAVGKVPKGVILATANLDDISESGVILRRAKQNKVENARIPKKSWDVLCQQISGILLDLKEIPIKQLLTIIRSAYPFEKTTTEELEAILKFMSDQRFLEIQDEMVKQYKRTRVFYYEHLSTIPDVRQVRAVDLSTRTSIGSLDEDFVTHSVESGLVFVIRGRPWKVVSVDDESGEVLCAPVTQTEIEAPRWIGEMIPVPYEVASEVAKVWNLIMTKSEHDIVVLLEKEYGLSKNAQEHMISTVSVACKQLGKLPDEKQLVIEDFSGGIVLHAPFGTKTNETLGVVIAALLTTRMGTEVGVERDPYRILFTSIDRIIPEQIHDVLREYDSDQISSILKMAIKHTQNFSSRFIHVGRRMGIIRRDAKAKEVPIRHLIRTFEGTPVFEEAIREVLNDKLDEKRMMGIFEGVAQGTIKVHTVKTGLPSPLARLIIEEKTRFEVMGEITDEGEVLRMMEERLLARKFRLVCMGEGKWNSVRTISTLDEDVTCPICDSKMVAVVYPSDKEFAKIIAKRKRGETLTKSEERKFMAGSLTANLVAGYGKTALLVLAGRGIGAQTASRILKPGMTERITILRMIAKAEKEYERTKPFWN